MMPNRVVRYTFEDFEQRFLSRPDVESWTIRWDTTVEARYRDGERFYVVRLHHQEIAVVKKSTVSVRTCGHNTALTQNRLNGILHEVGYNVSRTSDDNLRLQQIMPYEKLGLLDAWRYTTLERRPAWETAEASPLSS